MRFLPLLLAATILAGCTNDGYRGEIDANQTARDQAAQAAALWDPAGAVHPLVADLQAPRLQLSGDLAPIRFGAIAPHVAGNATLALENVAFNGTRGWITFAADPAPTLTSQGAFTIRLDAPTVLAAANGLSVLPVGDERPEILVEPGHAAMPDALRQMSAARYHDLALGDRVTLAAQRITFYDTNGSARPLNGTPEIVTDAATLVALTPNTIPPQPATLAIPIDDTTPLSWDGNVTMDASRPTGSLSVSAVPHDLAGVTELSIRANGSGDLVLARAASGWALAAWRAKALDVRTDQTERLGARIALAPNTIQAVGPAGNVTRVKVVLAETSLGADARITGYRINESVKARYIGAEPFPITREMIDLINRTDAGPITPVIALSIGIALPFVAIGEAFASFLNALFPPTVEGPLHAGEAEVLTFDLQMPQTPQNVTIEIDAANAAPATAVISLTPG